MTRSLVMDLVTKFTMKVALFFSILLGASGILGKAINEFDRSISCAHCDKWNLSQKPFRVYGNTYYVGVRGLSAVLIASSQGLVLLDAGLPQSAPLIEKNIRSLGFRVEDIKLILNSHAHFDHAGGIARIQHDSSAVVVASVAGAKAMGNGDVVADDPQFELGSVATKFPAAKNVRIVQDGEIVHLGDTAITAHYTPGHIPGSTSWTWQSCQAQRCMNIVYADSLNPISAPDFHFLGDINHPGIVEKFQQSIRTIAELPCDILLTVHPDSSHTLEKLQQRQKGIQPDPFVDTTACSAYAADAKQRLEERLIEERLPTASKKNN